MSCQHLRLACAFVTLFVSNYVLPRTVLASETLELQVISSRPDMVSGGDVLIQVAGLANGVLPKVRATLSGHDVTKAFRPGKRPGSLVGRVGGLTLGKNTLEIKVGRTRKQLTLTSHPITGPIISGPHQIPFVCGTETAGLGPPQDANCSAETVVEYFYKSTELPAGGPGRTPPGAVPQGFKPFNPKASRPSDLARTTTTEGQTVDYVVRRETGTINRAIYEIAFLHDPDQPLPDPWTNSPGWNGSLVYSFGGGCSAGYVQILRESSALNYAALSGGYALAGSSLNFFGATCNDVISAETMMMVKEHFIKQFGVPVNTIGWGGSGGSMAQYLIAQNYPGLLDGITPSDSFPDNTTFITSGIDCPLLDHAFSASLQAWTEEQKTAVAGFGSWEGSCTKSWMLRSASRPLGFALGLVRADICNASIPKALVYDTVTNRTGARCDIFDDEVNLYGKDPLTGFARRPLDNVGVQYGLEAFNARRISAEQFLDLNMRIGGYDADGNIVPRRSIADPEALRRAYQYGRMNMGAGSLGTIPIVDFRRYYDPDLHDKYRSFVVRARLIAANGYSDNQVILTVSPKTAQQILAKVDILNLMKTWLDNLARDTSPDSAARKVVRSKPAELADACWTPEGDKITEPQTYNGQGRCNQMYPSHSNPRIAAGAPLSDDILKCTLKPVDPKDYVGPMTADQIVRLKAIFSEGVCDYSRPGVGQQKLQKAWRKY